MRAENSRRYLLTLICLLVSLLVPGIATASTPVGAETRVRGLDLGIPHSAEAARLVILGTHQGYELAYDDFASGCLLAARGAGALGSTGRTVANSLKEKLAMEQVVSNPGGRHLANVVMSDARWSAAEGRVKMAQSVNGVEIHYVRNTRVATTVIQTPDGS